METITEIPTEVKEFLQMNLFSESYRSIKHEYQYPGKNEIDFSIQPPYIIEAAKKDLKIIAERQAARNKINEILVGDVIALPDGQKVIISYIWDDTVQTSAGGSLHLNSSGTVSFSGGLDSGMKKEDLILTNETEKRSIWIFHAGHSGGGRGVYSKIDFKVYRTKEGADLSGIPQIEALKKAKFLETCETITRTDGNGNKYTLPLPEVHICEKLTDEEVKKIEDASGLKLKQGPWNYYVQPQKKTELNSLLNCLDFKSEFYNNGTFKNTLRLTFKK